VADSVELNGPQLNRFADALTRAYNGFALKKMLLGRLDKYFEDYELSTGYPATVLNLVSIANQEGWPIDLLLAARASNPRNPKLIAFEQELQLGLLTPAEQGQLEKIVNQRKHFDHIERFISKLGGLSNFVCAVEVPGGGGTGLLVGHDLVLTNYHVVEPVLKGGASPANCSCRFDFKAPRHGNTVNPGVFFPFGSGDTWRVATSPYSQADLVVGGTDWRRDELDFALLRVQGSPGTQPVLPPAQEAPMRGWLPLSSKPPGFAAGDTLHMIQHPRDEDSRPVKQLPQQFATGNVLEFKGGGLRVRHDASTLPGSSGSPCFNDSLELAALHHAGEPGNQLGVFGKYNQAVPIGEIVRWLGEHELQSILDQSPPAPVPAEA
jgi:hypothetical protein